MVMFCKLIFITLFYLFLACSTNTYLVFGEEINLIDDYGVYKLPVLINDSVKLNFIVDTGASETYIPVDVILTLIRTDTISEKDLLTPSQYVDAQGDTTEHNRVLIKSLKIGNTEIKNIVTAIGDIKGELLLGQNALKKIEPWQINSKKQIFIIQEKNNTQSITSLADDNRYIRLFIKQYLNFHNKKSLYKLPSLYSSKVDYYNKGTVDKSYIENDKADLFFKWPIISYRFEDFDDIKFTVGDGVIKTDFNIRFYVFDNINNMGVQGRATIFLTLIKTKNGFKITSEKQLVKDRKWIQ